MLTMDDGYPRQQRLDSFTIEIENANDPPTDIKLTNSVIKENQPPGTIIGNVHLIVICILAKPRIEPATCCCQVLCATD